MPLRRKLISSYLVLVAASALAHDAVELSTVEVRAKAENLEGIATAGSEGVVSSQRLAAVPILRPGEALEMVPGLIVTQHAGDGKANQYFLRGFNLDHGTDRKGPYYAEEGDFASAGAAHIDYFRKLDTNLAELTLGQHGYARSLLAGSPAFGNGHLLYGLEVFHNDGPWQVDENYRKLNGVLRYSQGNRYDGWSVTGMAYRGRWTSTDQIAERAIASGTVDRFGTLDPTTGGQTFRYSLAGDWTRRGDHSQSKASVWWLRSGLDLWSNFQYCLNDFAANGNCALGDQFKQSERRQAGGFALAQSFYEHWGSLDVTNTVGLQ